MIRESRHLSLNDNDILSQGFRFAGLDFRTTSFVKILGDSESLSLMISVWPDRAYHKYSVVRAQWPSQEVTVDRGVIRHAEDLAALLELSQETLDKPA